jgi:DNA-binding NarL/FixJ family response regulator
VIDTRIIIADRGELFTSGVTQLLAEHGYVVLGVAATGEEALALAAGDPDSLVLVDEAIDGKGAAAFVRSLIRAHPGHRSIVMNGAWDISDVLIALAAGASGVVDKTCSPEHLFAAIDIVAGGGLVLSSEAVDGLRDKLTEVFELVAERNMRGLELTSREIEVLRLLPTSMTQLQMAAHLHVSRKTVQNNASSLYRKLGAGGRGEGVSRAIELGLLSPASAGRPRNDGAPPPASPDLSAAPGAHGAIVGPPSARAPW